jgi:thioredoxin 1
MDTGTERLRGPSVVSVRDERSFNTLIAEREPILVLFDAPWCPSGKLMRSALAELEATVRVAAVDVDIVPGLARTYRLVGVPAVLLFRESQLAATRLGEADAATLGTWLSRYIDVSEPAA